MVGERRISGSAILAAAIISALAAIAAHASTVAQLSLSDVVRRSNFIAEALVIPGSKRIVTPQGGLVKTCLSFQIIDALKGRAASEAPELCFLGGARDAYLLEVPGIQIPREGSRFILFVNDFDNASATPLTGGDQGMLRVHANNEGVEVVLTANYEPIVDLDFSAIPVSQSPTAGVAAGVQVGPPGILAILRLERCKELIRAELRR